MPRTTRARHPKRKPDVAPRHNVENVEDVEDVEGSQRIRGRLQLERNGSTFLAPTRVDLLEAIRALGSITAAAKSVGLSYKAAWDAVDAMNNQSVSALVKRSVGGSQGGGTRLTDYGERVLELVRRIEHEYADVLRLLEDPGSELAEFHQLQRQLSLATSARNQWIGRVTQVALDVVRAEISVALGPVSLRASVSASSVQRLGIAPGVELCLLVKATAVSVEPATEGTEGPVGVRGRRNRLPATVTEITRGHGQIEVTARLQGERSVTAVVPATGLAGAHAAPRLRKGSLVVASFAPEQVVLVQLDMSSPLRPKR